MNTEKVAAGQTIFPGLRYADARNAIAWLQRAFGAEPHAVYDGPNGCVAHAELVIAGNVVMLGDAPNADEPAGGPAPEHPGTTAIYVVLPDAAAVDALHARAVEAGADITRAPNDTDYGSHEFGARDPAGHAWSFGTYRPG